MIHEKLSLVMRVYARKAFDARATLYSTEAKLREYYSNKIIRSSDVSSYTQPSENPDLDKSLGISLTEQNGESYAWVFEQTFEILNRGGDSFVNPLEEVPREFPDTFAVIQHILSPITNVGPK